ncbi:hypothetical protein NIES4072_30930 [Nostoc commune NIES-4072]|uniref:Uncharacterized protein n=1 Tax=Nostoc commune NIES-4072 TaxID=2005467 RepID=A0A2R5FKX4_NOSCO|nr:hypothetical protein NIES4070_59820 [Nostoc commune HK-02]GBG19426.1 hypothetical protein NIES4072_30930 [Nostoc commune NIES-4072]
MIVVHGKKPLHEVQQLNFEFLLPEILQKNAQQLSLQG